MDVLVVGGGGTIGSTVAYTLSVLDPSTNVTLVDVQADAAEGHGIDLRHSTRHAAHAAGRPDFDLESTGTVETASPDPELVTATDCVVMAASVPRPAGGDERGGRLTFLERNLEVADDVATWLGDADPKPVVVVTNPLDRIVYRLYEQTGWPRHRFVGYSLSESARIADELARMESADPTEIHCPVLGEHGEHIVPLFSRASVAGEPLSLSPAERRNVIEYVRDVPYEVLQLRGPKDSSRWVTARGVASVVRRLGDDAAAEPVCLSTPLDGEYGFGDVALSVPVLLGAEGIEEIVEWSLSVDEWERFGRAYRAVRDRGGRPHG